MRVTVIRMGSRVALAVWLACTGFAGQDGKPFLHLQDAGSLLMPQPGNVRTVLGDSAGRARILGQDFGPRNDSAEYAFVAADMSPAGSKRTVRRSLVFLRAAGVRPAALFAFERIKPAARQDAAPCWTLDGFKAADAGFTGEFDASGMSWFAQGAAFLPLNGRAPRAAAGLAGDGAGASVCWDDPAEDPRLLASIQFVENGHGSPVPIETISEIDLVGFRLADWVVLFHTGLNTARSAVYFEVQGDGNFHYLITGLTPGDWEVWRNGFLADPQASVSRNSSALYFEARAGNYFLRPLN